MNELFHRPSSPYAYAKNSRPGQIKRSSTRRCPGWARSTSPPAVPEWGRRHRPGRPPKSVGAEGVAYTVNGRIRHGGCHGAGAAGGVAATTVRGTDTDSSPWRSGQTAPNNGWSSWASLGSPPNGSPAMPAVSASADGRLEVFLHSYGVLWHIWQTPGGGWSDWTSHGTPPGTQLYGDSPAAIAANSEGRLELFTVGEDGVLWHLWQTVPNGCPAVTACPSPDSRLGAARAAARRDRD
jgi:hypothetical protein